MDPDLRRGRLALLLLTSVVLMGCGSKGDSIAGSGPDPAASEQPSLPATSPAPSSPATSTTTYEDHGVSFDYPSAWEDLGWPVEDASWSVQFGGPAGTGYVDVQAFEAADEITATEMDRFAQAFFNFVQNEAMNDVPRGTVDQIRVADVAAVSARFAGDLGYKTAVVFVDGTTIYALDCFTPDRSKDEPCEKMLSTFRFTS